MQNENSLYEVPADLLTFTHTGLGEAEEIGEAQVVSTIFGKARVRIVRKENQSGWLWLLAALGLLLALAVIWWMQGAPLSPETGSVASEPLQQKPQIQPQPQIPEPNIKAPQIPGLNSPGQNMPVQQNNPVTNTPAPAADTAITAQPAIEQPAKTEPVKQAPAKKLSSARRPKKPPLETGDDQAEGPQGMGQSGEAPGRTTVSITPAVTEPAIQITKTPNTADKPATNSGARTSPPVPNDQQPGQTGAQP